MIDEDQTRPRGAWPKRYVRRGGILVPKVGYRRLFRDNSDTKKCGVDQAVYSDVRRPRELLYKLMPPAAAD